MSTPDSWPWWVGVHRRATCGCCVAPGWECHTTPAGRPSCPPTSSVCKSQQLHRWDVYSYTGETCTVIQVRRVQLYRSDVYSYTGQTCTVAQVRHVQNTGQTCTVQMRTVIQVRDMYSCTGETCTEHRWDVYSYTGETCTVTQVRRVQLYRSDVYS